VKLFGFRQTEHLSRSLSRLTRLLRYVPRYNPTHCEAMRYLCGCGLVGPEKVNCGSRFSHLNLFRRTQEFQWNEERKVDYPVAATIWRRGNLSDRDPEQTEYGDGDFR